MSTIIRIELSPLEMKWILYNCFMKIMNKEISNIFNSYKQEVNTSW